MTHFDMASKPAPGQCSGVPEGGHSVDPSAEHDDLEADAAAAGADPAPGRWIVLVGLMGAGKSAVGRALAETTGRAHLDVDDEIERAARRTIAEIFARDGEGFFRAREAEIVGRVLAGPPGILSTGGGAWMSAKVRGAVAGRGVSVWLRADLDTLWTRVRGRAHRPLLRGADGREVLARLIEERSERYALADVTVESVPGRGVAETAQRVAAALRARP